MHGDLQIFQWNRGDILYLKFGMIIIFSLIFIPPFSLSQERDFVNRLQQQNCNSILFVLEHKDFSCQFCLNNFIMVSDIIQQYQDSTAICCVVIKFKESFEEHEYSILKHQMRGFKRANGIRYPLVLDESDIFGCFGTSLIVMNHSRQHVKLWPFPIDPKEIERIIEDYLINKDFE